LIREWRGLQLVQQFYSLLVQEHKRIAELERGVDEK
jgi:hypothetical protein